jgi:ribosome-associated toxin RatA of RatAB toxin-antitoxin module
MADRTISSLDIAAPAAKVMAVIADLGRYPEWVPQLSTVEVVERTPEGLPAQAHFVMAAGPLADDYTLAYTWSMHEVSWRLVSARSIKALDGSYRLREHDGVTEVEYALVVEVELPMIGPLRRTAERVLVDTALRTLRKRVEG